MAHRLRIKSCCLSAEQPEVYWGRFLAVQFWVPIVGLRVYWHLCWGPLKYLCSLPLADLVGMQLQSAQEMVASRRSRKPPQLLRTISEFFSMRKFCKTVKQFGRARSCKALSYRLMEVYPVLFAPLNARARCPGLQVATYSCMQQDWHPTQASS